MVPDLPEDILHLICGELFKQQDFPTLFNCCSTNKTLASNAVNALYRYVNSLRATFQISNGEIERNMMLPFELMPQMTIFLSPSWNLVGNMKPDADNVYSSNRSSCSEMVNLVAFHYPLCFGQDDTSVQQTCQSP
jgi:hypothetical protein